MKITFVIPSIVIEEHITHAERVIWTNMKNDSRIEESFFNHPIIDLHRLKFPKVDDNLTVGKFSKRFNHMEMIILDYFERFLHTIDEIKDKVVFVSLHSVSESYILKPLLERGKKVIVGGPLINNINIQNIWRMVDKWELKREKENLTVVKGYVTLDTDLYEIAQSKEREIFIRGENYNRIFDPSNLSIPIEETNKTIERFNAIIRNKMRIKKFIEPNTFSIQLKTRCPWNKCEFCHRTQEEDINFGFNDPLKILNTNLAWYNNGIPEEQVWMRLEDSYCDFTDQRIIDMLEAVPDWVKVTGLVGYRNILEDSSYVDMINRYLNRAGLGLESFSDFTLHTVNKGYSKRLFFKALDEVKRRLSRNVAMENFVLLDIPAKNEKDIIENFETMLKVKNEMRAEGFDFYYRPSILRFVSDDLMKGRSKPYIEMSDDFNDEYASGDYRWKKYIDSFYESDFISYIFPDLFRLFRRLDENGNPLKSDLDIVPPDLFEEIFDIKTWG